jgi:hypothetical protein
MRQEERPQPICPLEGEIPGRAEGGGRQITLAGNVPPAGQKPTPHYFLKFFSGIAAWKCA